MRYLQLDWSGASGAARYLLTLATLGVGLVVGGVLVGVVLGIAGATIDPDATSTAVTPDALGVPPLLFFVIALVPFVVLFFVLWGCLRVLHRRPLRSLVSPDRVDSARLVHAGAAWGGLMLATTLAAMALDPGSYRFVFEPVAFLQLAGVALLLIPIQASTEELLMRGYLMQGLARWTRSGWIALVSTSLLFGALHGMNTEVAVHGALLTMPYYIGFGLLMGGMTLVDDGLELALGIHIANNLFGTVLVTSPESSLPTPALVRAESAALSAGSLLLWFVTAGAFVLLMARRYNWTWAAFANALGRVEPPENAHDAAAPDAAAPETPRATGDQALENSSPRLPTSDDEASPEANQAGA